MGMGINIHIDMCLSGNRHYTKPVEYTTLVRIYFGELNYKLCQARHTMRRTHKLRGAARHS